MKRKIFLERFFHRDRWNIAIRFDYDESLGNMVKAIPGSSYSVTHRCFYIDDSEENIKLLIKSLKEFADVDISSLAKKKESQSEKHGSDQAPVQIRSSEDDDPFVSRTVKRIEPSGSSGNVNPVVRKPADNVEFRINEDEGRLIIKFLGRYDQEWVKEILSYGRCYYDKFLREWSLSWSKLTVDSLSDYFASKNVRLRVTRDVVPAGLAAERKACGDEIRERPVGSKALDGLDLLSHYLEESRYSPRTRESYLSALDFFFRYFSERDPADITEEEISMFLYDHIIRLGYSASYQNQMVSAIKTYYRISGRGRVAPEMLERPRRTRALPKVFSKEEVTRILNSTRNSKHKTLLWMIYSCGLRRSEAVNLRLADLDRDRGIVHIREGKGGVDRIVPVPSKVWEKLNDYIGAYKPAKYLFEGQAGGKYSVESVYHVFRNALDRAGIHRDMGVHCLRHSYATHLHENGLDIRYIQELLGHRSTRTTEIYTHVSRRNLIQVRSPIEDLDVK